MKKAVITVLSCLSFILSAPAARAMELIPGGQAVGIEISTDGVMVAGVAQVETREGPVCPAREAGLKEGDLILEVNGRKPRGAMGLIDMVAQTGGDTVRLKVRREQRIMRFNLRPALSGEDKWQLGMWLKDSVTGIGTVTFFDPETGIYGALGHGVSDLTCGRVLPISGGSIRETGISGIVRPSSGSPGELSGGDRGRALGTIEKNTPEGIYGHMQSPFQGKMLCTGQIAMGAAEIISTIDGKGPERYQVEIVRLLGEGEGERVMLSVTDPRLKERTGGIVQGMSGSPIIQGGKLVGAVTHVFINDPRRGYGITIQDMLKTAGIPDAA